MYTRVGKTVEQGAIRAVRDYVVDLLQREDYCKASVIGEALRILVNDSQRIRPLNAMGFGEELKMPEEAYPGMAIPVDKVTSKSRRII